MTVFPLALSDHLSREVTTLCHCWRLTRTDGMITGYTDHDRPLLVSGTPSEPRSGFTATEARDTMGLAVDTVDVAGALSSADIRNEDVAAGLYDNAKIETFLVNWRQPEDFALLRTATIGKITRSGNSFVAELESLTHRLDQPNGRTMTRACDAELGDARCGISLAQPGFSGAGLVEAIDTAGTLFVSGLRGFASGWFTNGLVTWTSGARAGLADRIEDHRGEGDAAVLVLVPRGGLALAAGDAFTIVAGCDKAFGTCKEKFDNALNFRGFPHLPGNDAAYDYASDSGVFDGGPIVP